MRFCFIRHAYFPRDMRVRRQAEALISAGHSVDVICLRQSDEKARDNFGGIEIYRLPVRRHRGMPLWIYLLEYLAFFFFAFCAVTFLSIRRRYNAIQTYNPPDFLVFCTVLPALFGVRIIWDTPECTPELFLSRFGVTEKSFLYRAAVVIEFLCGEYADQIITVHTIQEDVFVERGLEFRKMRVNVNSADESIFSRAKYDDDSKSAGFRLVHNGTIMQRLGLDVLIEAIARLDDRIPGLVLDVYGDGDFLKPCIRLAKRLGVEEKVRFHGFVRLEEVAAAFMRADLCVIPNRRDAFTDLILPGKMLEAIAMNVPALVTGTPAIERYFPESAVATVEAEKPEALAGEIARLARDSTERERMIRDARIAYEPIRWEHEAKRYVAVLEESAAA